MKSVLEKANRLCREFYINLYPRLERLRWALQSIPLVGRVAAGPLSELDEAVEKMEPLCQALRKAPRAWAAFCVGAGIVVVGLSTLVVYAYARCKS